MEPGPNARRRSLSEVLRDISDDARGEVTLGEVVQSFGRRAFGALLFVFAIPNMLPLPPGATTILGAPIVILAPQIAFGVRHLWMPKGLSDKPMKRAWFKNAYDRVAPTLTAIEKVSGPRLHWLLAPVSERLIGMICSVLAIVLILPIPLGNIAPAATIAVFGLALVQRDGVVALVGYLMAALSFSLLTVGFTAAWLAVRHLLVWVGWI